MKKRSLIMIIIMTLFLSLLGIGPLWGGEYQRPSGQGGYTYFGYGTGKYSSEEYQERVKETPAKTDPGYTQAPAGIPEFNYITGFYEPRPVPGKGWMAEDGDPRDYYTTMESEKPRVSPTQGGLPDQWRSGPDTDTYGRYQYHDYRR
jgi:hypothetical protein